MLRSLSVFELVLVVVEGDELVFALQLQQYTSFFVGGGDALEDIGLQERYLGLLLAEGADYSRLVVAVLDSLAAEADEYLRATLDIVPVWREVEDFDGLAVWERLAMRSDHLRHLTHDAGLNLCLELLFDQV